MLAIRCHTDSCMTTQSQHSHSTVTEQSTLPLTHPLAIRCHTDRFIPVVSRPRVPRVMVASIGTGRYREFAKNALESGLQYS